MSTSAPSEPVIRLRGLRKRFGGHVALAGIDLDLARGQIVGVVGPDGAGKTTLIRCLAGLLEVEADEARVLGFDLREDVTGLKARTGYVPQAFSLQRDLSVRENLRFTARLHRLSDEEFERRSRELLERTGLAPFAERAAGALSGGMKQKLAVSNALLTQPPLLLLDEPTAGVDVVARGEIWTLLERDRENMLVLMSTSYLDEAAACDRIVYLDDGRIVATGTPAELRAMVGLDLYRLWSDVPRALAIEAAAIDWVSDTRAGAQFARVEVPRAKSPGTARALAALGALPGTLLAEAVPLDMESALLALARVTPGHAHPNALPRPAGEGQGGSASADGGAHPNALPRPAGEGQGGGASADGGVRPPPPRPSPASGGGRFDRRDPPIITARGLTRKFGDFTAVDALDIHVSRGSIFAFLGANGSGKSTTIRMLIGLLAPTKGEIEVDGIDVGHHPRRVRDHIGYMGQKVSLYQGLSLRENVEFYAGLYGLGGAQLERSWGALRERFSLAEVEHEKSEDLPAGIRQRAGLALATLHHPRVLFLDEPTAGVDVHNRNLFWELIQDEARGGTTVFVTTHFLEEVDYCDWVSFIDQGRLIADAEPETLRRLHSQGYRVELRVPADAAARVRQALGGLGHAVAGGDGVLSFLAPALDAALLGELQRISSGMPDAHVSIEQPQMTDIFRTVLLESAARRIGAKEAA